ncbi:uncharacterized protein LOC129718267 isoform X2 [Wyeomyia smithii]|uniref:uncharacterized protein LOC129718267 isoform X2 n=1 Tax=Wyeomyia smithii TaxID=174621 RepID=UPI002468107C|nr:uncharacterized protein LOC129718267 isoform X2 [Wyeomyia smithii]XP_055524847.1 uncharacterized protein LOC129718267 isoform X2 [Wyeomyia smithii]
MEPNLAGKYSGKVPLHISPPPPPPPSQSSSEQNLKKMGIPDTQSDFNQWLHAMKMVARLPGGIPPDFRRKLWMALSDRYLQTKKINWEQESKTYLSEQSNEDDEELGIQIVKDLHRTGSSLCTGPSGAVNQAKLKRVLLGYSRFNPEVGYCQGFNMLGALILQVMDKNEIDSMKVMILLIEGLLPAGYFCGSLGGLQADMAVFRDLLGTKLPKLARHLQKLQGPECAFEPPLTNVFTMQWFLTLFCTCLPIPAVLRIWDLILIEGSDVLLRTALSIWGLLESRILQTKTADDFYCKMGALSSELVNGNLIDCNELIQRIVDIGPIADLDHLREKHLTSITQLNESSNLRIFYSDDECESDEESRLTVTATAWGLRSGRRSSLGFSTNMRNSGEGKEKINLDISLLKKQYVKLRERQRQAHIILTAAVARQSTSGTQSSSTQQIQQLLVGKNAILSNKGKRLGPPQGAVPPARVSKVGKQSKLSTSKPIETLHWKDMDEKQRRGSIKRKDVQKDNRKPTVKDDFDLAKQEPPKLIKSLSASSAISNLSESGVKRRSESSSYSEESDVDSSTSTSLCDDDLQLLSASSLEASPMKRRLTPDSIQEVPDEERLIVTSDDVSCYNSSEVVDAQNIGFTLSGIAEESFIEPHNNSTTVKLNSNKHEQDNDVSANIVKHKYPDLVLPSPSNDESLPITITSTNQLSPIPDICHYVSMSTISPLRTPSSIVDFSDYLNNIPNESIAANAVSKDVKSNVEFNVNEEGVTNQLFERMNVAERPNKLDLIVFKERKVSESLANTTESIVDQSDNTSKIDNYSFTDASSRTSISASFVRELPTGAAQHNDVPFLPSNTDMSTIISANSPTQKGHRFQIVSATTPSPKNSPENGDVNFTSRVRFLKEKSFSMDDPIKSDDIHQEDIAKRSASEGLVSADLNSYKCNKMFEIIKENSLILDRMIKKPNRNDISCLNESIDCSSNDRTDVNCNDNIRTDMDDLKCSNLNQNEDEIQTENDDNSNTSPNVTDSLKTNYACSITGIEQTRLLSNIMLQKKLELKSNTLGIENVAKLTSKKNGEAKMCNESIDSYVSSGQPISKTDLLIKRTEEQLARFKEPEPQVYYIRNENFQKNITPEEEKEFSLTKAVSKQAALECNFLSETLMEDIELQSSKNTLNKTNEPDSRPKASITVKQQNFHNLASFDKSGTSLAFTEVDTRSSSASKTDELIKKGEEQLAKFKNHDKKVLERLEKRLSLIDFKPEDMISMSQENSERKTYSKTEQVIKKSEEQISRIKIESPFITKIFPTRPFDEEVGSIDIMSVSCSSKTEEIIKKTDEQLARFKAAAESNAEKRKSRHEINELLQLRVESPDLLSRSSDLSIKFEDISIRDESEAIIIKNAQAELLKTIKIPDEVKSSKTDTIIKRIEDGKIKLGEDYITTIKTIDYLKQSNANLSATLSSIESSIKAIDGLCDHDSEVQSNRINDTIQNLEKSLKQFDSFYVETPIVLVHDCSNNNRCRPSSTNRPSRPRKRREYSPRRKKGKDRDEKSTFYNQTDNSTDHSPDNLSSDRESSKTYTFHSFYSTSPPITPRVVSPLTISAENIEYRRPLCFKSSSHDRYLLQKEVQFIKFDKSPSSPIINKSCLESLLPATPIVSDRTTRSAENSPPLTHNAIGGIQNSLLHHQTKQCGSEYSHINKSCENILMRFDRKSISAIAASYPVASTILPSPTMCTSLNLKHETTLNFDLSASPNKNLN